MSDKKFPHPLNTFIEEEVQIPVMKPHVNEGKKRVEFTQEMTTATRKTMYSNNKPRVVICKDHHFVGVDSKKCIFKCTKCNYHKIAYPVTYRFNKQTGKLIHRVTGNTV